MSLKKKDEQSITFISDICSINGEIKSSGIVDICGRFEGKISAEKLFIRNGGFVTGEIFASSLFISGSFEGTCMANELFLHKDGSISGKIFYNKIGIEDGGKIYGVIDNSIDEQKMSDILSVSE